MKKEWIEPRDEGRTKISTLTAIQGGRRSPRSIATIRQSWPPPATLLLFLPCLSWPAARDAAAATHTDSGWYTKLYKMVTLPLKFFFPSVLTATHASCIFRRLTITLRKLLSNTHFDDIARVTRFFPCSNLTEKNHVVTRSTSTKTENIDTCDLFIHVKSRENRYWSRTDACVPIVTLCCTEKRKNCRLQHWRADEISCTDRCDTRYASHIQLSRAADSGRLSVEKVLRLAYAIAALLAADTWPIASRVFGRSLCAPIP